MSLLSLVLRAHTGRYSNGHSCTYIEAMQHPVSSRSHFAYIHAQFAPARQKINAMHWTSTTISLCFTVRECVCVCKHASVCM